MSGSSTTLTNSDNDLRRETRATSAVRDGRSLYEFGSGDKEEFRSDGQDWRKVINWAFLSSVSSLLFSSPYFITSLDLGPVQMASARVLPPPDLSQTEVEFPRAPDPPKGYCTVPIGSGTFQLVRVRTRHDCYCFPFLFFSLIRFMQPRRSAPKEGDNVTAARDPAG
jgi:hypothetical protein